MSDLPRFGLKSTMPAVYEAPTLNGVPLNGVTSVTIKASHGNVATVVIEVVAELDIDVAADVTVVQPTAEYMAAQDIAQTQQAQANQAIALAQYQQAVALRASRQ